MNKQTSGRYQSTKQFVSQSKTLQDELKQKGMNSDAY